jgi:hypothetical protein
MYIQRQSSTPWIAKLIYDQIFKLAAMGPRKKYCHRERYSPDGNRGGGKKIKQDFWVSGFTIGVSARPYEALR